MYQLLAKKCVGYVIEHNIGKRENSVIYAYLFEVMFSLFFDTLLLLILGGVMNQFVEIIVYMLFYIALRISSGGAHMPGYCSCIIFFIITGFGSMNIIYLLTLHYGGAILCLLLFTGTMCVIKYAPVSSKNKRIEDLKVKELKKKSRVTVGIEVVILIFVMKYQGINTIVIAGVAAIWVQSMLLIPFFNR